MVSDLPLPLIDWPSYHAVTRLDLSDRLMLSVVEPRQGPELSIDFLS